MAIQIPTLTDSELADIKEKLYSRYLKFEEKRYAKEKKIFESATIIDPKHYDFSYIKHGGNVAIEVKENDIPTLIEIVSKVDVVEDYPRTKATWWIKNQTDSGSQFSEEEPVLFVGYKKFAISDKSVIAGIVKRHTDHVLWKVAHNYLETADVLDKIGYGEHASLIRKAADERKAENDRQRIVADERRNRPYVSKSDVVKLVIIRDLLVRHDIRDGHRMFVGEDFGKHSIPRYDVRQYVVKKTQGLLDDLNSVERYLDFANGKDNVIFIGPTIEAVDNFIGPVAADDSSDFGKTIREGVVAARKHVFPGDANITTQDVDTVDENNETELSVKTLVDAVSEVQKMTAKSPTEILK